MRITRSFKLVRELIYFLAILLSVFGVSSYTHAQNDAPEIFLAGHEDMSIDQGPTYTEPGYNACRVYTSPRPRDGLRDRMPG